MGSSLLLPHHHPWLMGICGALISSCLWYEHWSLSFSLNEKTNSNKISWGLKGFAERSDFYWLLRKIISSCRLEFLSLLSINYQQSSRAQHTSYSLQAPSLFFRHLACIQLLESSQRRVGLPRLNLIRWKLGSWWA